MRTAFVVCLITATALSGCIGVESEQSLPPETVATTPAGAPVSGAAEDGGSVATDSEAAQQEAVEPGAADQSAPEWDGTGYPGLPYEGEMQTTPSGLQFAVITEGDGPLVERRQIVTVHYNGYLAEDGTMFDSSYDDNMPLQFVLNSGDVVPGWDEGVSTMKVGETRKLIIPPRLAYGNSGIDDLIPGNATLVFDVELIGAED